MTKLHAVMEVETAMDSQKKNIWNEVHYIVRLLPSRLAIFKLGGITKDELYQEIEVLRKRLYSEYSEASLIGGAFKHYVGLIKTQFDTELILLLNKIDELSQTQIELFAYHMQWNLIDLTYAELNRSED